MSIFMYFQAISKSNIIIVDLQVILKLFMFSCNLFFIGWKIHSFILGGVSCFLIKILVNSFTALAQELLAEEGVEYLLSEKFSQDPLEEHFGKQRGMGGANENPDAKQFGDNITVLQVAGSCINSSCKANVKRQSEQSPMKTHPLPKRRKRLL